MKTTVLWLLLLLVLLEAGCKSSSESAGEAHSSRLASVVIKGHSAAEVTLAAQQVFIENGYEKGPVKTGGLVFEKRGSGMNTLVYGDWSGKPVWFRVKVYLRQVGAPNTVLFDCDAFRVLERGDPHFEEEHKLTKLHRGTYQELLDKVSHRLQ
ncbi:MAG TPA: hypothetical protein VJA21_21880 [Verrucomicrobiae bacterium]